jgi:hypothetical protein
LPSDRPHQCGKGELRRRHLARRRRLLLQPWPSLTSSFSPTCHRAIVPALTRIPFFYQICAACNPLGLSCSEPATGACRLIAARAQVAPSSTSSSAVKPSLSSTTVFEPSAATEARLCHAGEDEWGGSPHSGALFDAEDKEEPRARHGRLRCSSVSSSTIRSTSRQVSPSEPAARGRVLGNY